MVSHQFSLKTGIGTVRLYSGQSFVLCSFVIKFKFRFEPDFCDTWFNGFGRCFYVYEFHLCVSRQEFILRLEGLAHYRTVGNDWNNSHTHFIEVQIYFLLHVNVKRNQFTVCDCIGVISLLSSLNSLLYFCFVYWWPVTLSYRSVVLPVWGW